MAKTMMPSLGEENELLNTTLGAGFSKTRKVTFGSNWIYSLKVFDYTRR